MGVAERIDNGFVKMKFVNFCLWFIREICYPRNLPAMVYMCIHIAIIIFITVYSFNTILQPLLLLLTGIDGIATKMG